MSEADNGEAKDPLAGEKASATASEPATESDVVFAEPEVEPAKVEPDPLEVAKAEAAKYREQLLRTAADFENFRKRSRREVEDAQRKGRESTLKELLPVFDNVERALSSADSAPDAKSVADGLRMVVRQFTTTLDRLGIKRIATVGAAFDPSLHEAIQHAESREHAAGVITAEVQPGYTLNDHLVRAAMVVVSKGAPEAEAAPDEADLAADDAETPADGEPDPVH